MRTLAVILVSLAFVAPVAAQPAVTFHVVHEGGKRKIVIDTPIDVNGRAPRPSVAILHPPLAVDYHWPAVDLSFVPMILSSVRGRVFTHPAGERP